VLFAEILNPPASDHFDGEGKTHKFALERIGTDWKLRAMGFAGDNLQEGKGEVDAQVWP
jgi:hypothetical protein